MSVTIHPTAIVDDAAVLGENVVIGPRAIIEADTVIGDNCRIGAGSIVRQFTTLGRDNVVDAYVCLGGDPQDYGFEGGSRSYLRIGDRNIFREFCTLNRATGAEKATVVGDGNMFMTAAHVGHNASVGDRCILINGSALGGYSRLGDRAILSAHVVVHQHCWVGEGVMTQGNSATSCHIPPYCMTLGVNVVCGLNGVGLRRAKHIGDEDRRQIKEAYRLLYRAGLTPEKALAAMDEHVWGEPADRFRSFVRAALEAEAPFNRGLPIPRRRGGRSGDD